MRLLLDENLSPGMSDFLVEAGHDVVHVRDRGLTSVSDDVVLALAVVVLGEKTIRIRRLPI